MRRLGPVAFASTFLLFVACASTEFATGPGTETPDASISEPLDGASPTPTATEDAAPSAPDASEVFVERSSTLGPAGGTFDADDGRFRIAVPPDALTKDTTITVKRAADGTPDVVASRVYDLGPNGTTFEKDIDVCIRTEAGTTTDKACLGYLDESTKPPKWTCEDECLTKGNDGLLCGSTSHFTNFAILLVGGRGNETKCTDSYIRSTGGTLGSSDGLTTVTFSKGSLEKGTRIYATTLAPIDNGTIGSNPYELSPNGKFGEPVEICVTPNFGAKTDTACLGYLDKDKWVCEDTCLEEKGGKLCGTTSHFTTFALLLVGGTGTKCPK